MIKKRIELAKLGQKYWNELESNGSLEEGFLVLWLCDEDLQLGQLALTHLPDLLKEKKAKGVYIFCLEENFEHWQSKVVKFLHLPYYLTLDTVSPEVSEGLLAFYEMYQFTERFYIISIEKPFGSKLPTLQKKLKYSKTKLLKHCIYQLAE